MVRIGSTSYYGTVSTLTTSYVEYSKTWTVSPATGTAWTAAEINAATFGYKWWVGPTTVQTRTTYMYVVVDYNIPTIPTVATSTATTSYNGTHNVDLTSSITNTGGYDSDMVGWVYGTTSNSTTPSSGEAPPASYTVNVTKVGTYGVESFSGTVAGLALNTTYYYRAFAHNSVGWAYSAESSFTTFNNPSVSTVAASNVGATITRINASVTDNGRDTTCTVEWVYIAGVGPYANYAAIEAGPGDVHVAATGTYSTGQTPYYDLSGLATSTQYWFCASITNDVSTQYGTPLTFTTESGIYPPTSFGGIPESDSVSLQWVKGVGSNKTLVRYSTGTYPVTTTDGNVVYFDLYTSTLHESLSPGTTYYYKAWGEASGTYSTSNTTFMITTLPAVATIAPMPTPTTPTEWYQTPNYIGLSGLPFYGMVNWFADSFQIPYATMWSTSGLMLCMFFGILLFGIGHKLIISAIGMTGLIVILSVMGVTPMWFLVPFVVWIFACMVMESRI